MKQVLTEIQDGTFASEFLTEMSPKGGRKTHFLAQRRIAANHQMCIRDSHRRGRPRHRRGHAVQ